MKVVLVTGSRNWPDDGSVERELDAESPGMLILGDCPTGADAYALRWAKANGVDYRLCRADWNHWRKIGRRGWAGPVRNYGMVRRLSNARNGAAIAFFDGGPGTADCINQLRAADFEPRIVNPDKEAP